MLSVLILFSLILFEYSIKILGTPSTSVNVNNEFVVDGVNVADRIRTLEEMVMRMNQTINQLTEQVSSLIESSVIKCDEFEMIIHTTTGRDQYTCFSKAQVIGYSGTNYGLNQYGTWTSTSTYMEYSPPSELGIDNPVCSFVTWEDENVRYFHYDQVGEKRLKWNSNVGTVSIAKIMFHAGMHGVVDSSTMNGDYPKDITFNFRNNGVLVRIVQHTFASFTTPSCLDEMEWIYF